jgi:hypothetical protein
MARGTTLVKLLDLYRAECGLSLNVAHNNQMRDTQVNHIQRTQEWLWEDTAWPLLRVERTLDTLNGQRYYSLPSDLHIDRISKVEVFSGAAWCNMRAGIDAMAYTTYNSDLDERQWPPSRWRIAEDNLGAGEQFEVWPIPNIDTDTATLEGRIKITGIRKLKALVADGDVADLDDRLITLFCAAEFLARSGAKDAQLKLDQANRRYAKVKGAQQPRKVFKMFGSTDGDNRPYHQVPVAVYNRTT